MIVIGFNTDPVWDIPTGSQTGLRLPGTNNRFPQTAMADFCFFLLHWGLGIDLGLCPEHNGTNTKLTWH